MRVLHRTIDLGTSLFLKINAKIEVKINKGSESALTKNDSAASA